MIHDFHCIDPSDMYSKSIKKWFRYYKQDKGGVKKMCEITRKWMGIGYEEGYTNGKMETMRDNVTCLLNTKLGLLSKKMIEKINNGNEKELNQIIIDIFNIENEDDILKYIH